MKNIQILDDADNCTYSIYEVNDEIFLILFPDDQVIEFAEDLETRLSEVTLVELSKQIWDRPIEKHSVNGIHGTIFYGFAEVKRKLYPNKKFYDDAHGFSPEQRRKFGMMERVAPSA